jgi:catechol 2,3-dioxygenase-like lactoylglutathione lyase family enzyme
MNMKSVSGLIFLVKDLDKSVEFYKKLGFTFRKEIPGISATAYLNWFWIELLLKSEVFTEEFKGDAKGEPNGAGAYAHISVEDTDEFYKFLQKEGFNLGNSPQDFPWGRREFVLIDPDGYKLVFFSK